VVAGNVGAGPKGGLVGRSAELDQIGSAVRQVAGGVGQALLVTGEAGIGKTRVVVEGLDVGVELGVRVFRAGSEV
jgi:AAA ATPase domain